MNSRVLIVGAGGLGQVAADILLQIWRLTKSIEPVGFVDDDSSLLGLRYLGLPVLGSVSAIECLPHDEALIAVSDNATRCYLYEKIAKSGGKFATVRHPCSVLAPGVMVGPGTIVCAGAAIGHGAIIGADSVVGPGCSVAHHSRLSDHVYLGPEARLDGNAVVGEGAIIGDGVTVLARRRVGAWARVEDGSVVERDVPDGATVSGVPAGPAERAASAGSLANPSGSERACCLRPIWLKRT